MRFVHPELLWLLLSLPLMAVGNWWIAMRRQRALFEFAGGREHLERFARQVNVHLRVAKLILVYLALAMAIVAASRPQWGNRLEAIERAGVDVVVVLDNSLSMAAEDIAPSRLGQAGHEIDSLLKSIEGNRVALITFAGQASLVCPLTLDHAALRLFLETLEPESVQIPGTALAEALRLAIRAFGSEAATDRSRALVLFSDGEDHEGGLEDVIPELTSAGITVYAVGCGTARGAPIPLEGPGGMRAGYKKDRDSKVVTTRLDETVLEQLALESGGRYYRATPAETEVQDIVGSLTAMDAKEFGAVLRTRYEERYQIPLSIALIALLAESLLGDRRKPSRSTVESSEVA